MASNNCIQPTHFRGVSFVANATSLTPLQRSADARRYALSIKFGKEF